MKNLARPALFLLIGLLVFGGAYLAVALLLPDPPVAPPGAKGTVRPTMPRPADGTIGDVEGVTLRSHDAMTGAPVAEIHVGQYRRKSDREIALTRVSATILAGDGLVTLDAPAGRVDVEAAADRRDRIDADTLGLADVARLRDVTLRYFAAPGDAAAGPGAAQFTLRVDNLVFDNSRFSLYTDDTTIDGQTVLADDVPVHVRGRDYDFDGRGLLVRWDGKTRRPTLFRIAKGQSLTIKDGTALLPKPVAAARPPPTPTPVLLASADSKAAARQVVQATRPATRPFSVYRATLQRQVGVTQRGEQLLRADAATAIFAAVPKLAATAPQPAAPERAGKSKPRPPAAGPAARRPAAPDKAPVVVTWEGELRVVLVEEDSSGLRDAEDARLRLDGSPVVLRQNGSEVRAPALFYDRGGDELRLVSDAGDFDVGDFDATPASRPAARVTLADDAGNTLVARTLVAHPDAGDATALGQGYADVPDEAGRRVRVRWDESCAFTFAPAAGSGDKSLRGVAARGAVNVTHPDFVLDAATLDLDLAPPANRKPTTKPAAASLQSVRAAGDVRCELSAAAEGLTGLSCDRLRVDVAADAGSSTRLTAEGDVRTRQQSGDLSADALTADLLQMADGGYDLKSLLARGNVAGTDAQERRLSAAAMAVTPVGTGRHVRLEGTSDAPATVTRGDDVLAGPVLTFDDARSSFAVPEPGRLDTLQPRGDQPPLPIRVTWDGTLRGDEQKVVADGGVGVAGSDATSRMDLKSETATLDLAPKPTTKERAATAPATRPAGDGDLLGALQRVTLDRDVRATAEELDGGGALARSFDLRSQSLVATPAGGQDVAVVIETPGRMLYRNARPADAGPEDAGPAAGFRGNAAFGWQGRLDWSPASGVLTMTGRATVAVEPAGRPAFELVADRFRVVTVRAGGRRDVASASADGSATFTTKGLKFDAARVDYDPAARTVTARGTAGAPVVVYDDRGVPTGRFGLLVYNLETARVDRVQDVTAGG